MLVREETRRTKLRDILSFICAFEMTDGKVMLSKEETVRGGESCDDEVESAGRDTGGSRT